MSFKIFDAKEARKATCFAIERAGGEEKLARILPQIAEEMVLVCCNQIQIDASIALRETKFTFGELKDRWVEYAESVRDFVDDAFETKHALVNDPKCLEHIVENYLLPYLEDLGYSAQLTETYWCRNNFTIWW